jgi:hypothetical protein
MPPSSRTINYDAVMSLCMEYIRDEMFYQIFTSTPLLSALYGGFGKKRRQGKGIRMINGGERIRVPLMYGKNSTVMSYSGYDQLDVTPQDGITTAFFDWRQLAGSVAISRLEERKNSGENAIKNLLESKVTQLKMTMADEVNFQLWGKTLNSAGTAFVAGKGPTTSSTTGTDIDPISMLIPKDPTISMSIGNINQSTYDWWRPVIVDGAHANGAKDSGATRGFAITNWATLGSAMRWIYNSLSKGAMRGSPDTIACDQLAYESYEAALDSRSRIVNETSGPVTMGFESVRFKGADMIWDEMIPDMSGLYNYESSSWTYGSMFFLNLDYLELVVDSGTDFITTPFVRPENQDAKVSQILAMMNLVCYNRKKCGMIYGLAVPYSS